MNLASIFDSGGRNVGQSWLTSSGGISESITYTYDADNELTNAKDPNSLLTFTYDSGGNQLSAAASGPNTGQPSLTLSDTYDPSHNVLSLQDNLSTAATISYAYDAALRLTTMSQSFSSGGSGGTIAGP